MAKCKYCLGEKPIFNSRKRLSKKGDFYPGIEVSLDDSILIITCAADVFEPNFLEEEVNICYCPMCGRKLND